MMNVWAYRVGTFSARGGEWDLSLRFDSLQNLLDQLANAHVAKGQVRKLAIVAHGDVGGHVQLHDGDLTAGTAARYAAALLALRDYLWVNARLIFYSCVAGRGQDGSALLNALSGKHLPGRHVIGFERFGVLSGMGQLPGEMRCATASLQFSGADRIPFCDPSATARPVTDATRKAEQILSEYSIYAKWSYQGKVIKIPYDEVNRRIEMAPRVAIGAQAVERALKDPHERAAIAYIAMKTRKPSREVERLYLLVQKAPYNFKWGAPGWRLRELVPIELKKIPRSPDSPLLPRADVVAFYKQQVIHKYRCAWEGCPGHSDFRHYCRSFVERIPNGPLV
jgi:hypothetical protein